MKNLLLKMAKAAVNIILWPMVKTVDLIVMIFLMLGKALRMLSTIIDVVTADSFHKNDFKQDVANYEELINSRTNSEYKYYIDNLYPNN